MKNPSYYIAPVGVRNSRPSAHRSFNHNQGVPRPLPLGHGGYMMMMIIIIIIINDDYA